MASDIFLNEQTAFSSLSGSNGLSEKYNLLRTRCMNCHSGSQDMILHERQATFDELFSIFQESKKVYSDVKLRLADLISSVKYIHEHHIAYLKNLQSRNINIQDYYVDEAFERSSIKSATEPDIIESAVSIQTSLIAINDTFYNLQHSEALSTSGMEFTHNIEQFYFSVNQFEDFSLDAQDGILV